MLERRESSLLFSLKELRHLEEDRVAEEAAELRRRDEEARRAREEAERRVREAAERVRLEAEAAEKRRLDEEQQRQREDQLRLEEAERRARVEAQMRLEEQRLKLEMEARVVEAPRRSGGLVAVAAFLAVGVAGLGFYAWNTRQQTINVQKQHDDAVEAKLKAEQAQAALAAQYALLDERSAALEAKIAELKARPQDANTAKEIEKLEQEQDTIRTTIRNRPPKVRVTPVVEPPKPPRGVDMSGLCPPDKPLCKQRGD